MTAPHASAATPAAVTALADYRVAYLSRQLSLTARREVHTGRAKFGAFGDGKEVAQVALAGAFRPGDWHAGYYRDQTLMLALGLLEPTGYFAKSTPTPTSPLTLPPAGAPCLATMVAASWTTTGAGCHSTIATIPRSDLSSTAGQMPRLVGLAYASRLYRELPDLHAMTTFSNRGNEVAFGIIGNASCAEGMFWEALNAIGVLRCPAVSRSGQRLRHLRA